jgi:plastocyanin
MRASLRGLLSAGALGFALFALVGQAAAGEVIVVKITDLAFSPATVKTRVGDTIVWINDDFLDHTATADDQSFDLAIGVGQSARLEVTRPGAVPYFCRVHPNMRGTIDVE